MSRDCSVVNISPVMCLKTIWGWPLVSRGLFCTQHISYFVSSGSLGAGIWCLGKCCIVNISPPLGGLWCIGDCFVVNISPVFVLRQSGAWPLLSK